MPPLKAGVVRESDNRHGGTISRGTPGGTSSISCGGGGGGNRHAGRDRPPSVRARGGGGGGGGLLRALVALTAVAFSQGSPDSEYLADLFLELDGPNWTNSTNWDDDTVALRDKFGIVATVDANGTECVRYLELANNSLAGTIPDVGEGQLKCLERLRLSDTGIIGGLPAGLSNLQSLRLLEVVETGLTGEIPAELGSLPELVNLHLYENDLSGSIPPELGNLGNLEELKLEFNNLDGIIPPQLGNLLMLEHLDLEGNNLIGLIPETFGNLQSLISLDLGQNELAGDIPEALGSLGDADLREADLEDNFLEGDIPDGLKVLYAEGALHLDGNLMDCCDQLDASGTALACCESRAAGTGTAPPYPTPAPTTVAPTPAPLATPAPFTRAPTLTPTPAPSTAAPSFTLTADPPAGSGGTGAAGNGGDDDDPGGGTDGGTIAGIVVGTVVGAALLGCLWALCCRRTRKKHGAAPLPGEVEAGGGGGRSRASVTGTGTIAGGGGGGKPGTGGGVSWIRDTANGMRSFFVDKARPSTSPASASAPPPPPPPPPPRSSAPFPGAGGGNSADPRQYPSNTTHPRSPPDAPASGDDPVNLGSPFSRDTAGAGTDDAAAAAAVGQAKPPLPPRPAQPSPENSSVGCGGGGGGSALGGSAHASPFNSAGSANNNNNSNINSNNSTGEMEVSFHPLAPLTPAYSRYPVNAAAAVESEFDVRLGPLVRDHGDGDGGHGDDEGDGDGRGYRDRIAAVGPPVSVPVSFPEEEEEVGEAEAGRVRKTRFGPVSRQRDRPHSTDGGTGRRGPATTRADSPRSKSEEVTRPRHPPPPSLFAPPPADAEADQVASHWHGQPPDFGTPFDGDDSSTRRASSSSLFGSGSGRRLDAVLAVAKRISSAAQNSSIAGVPEVAMLVESLVTLSMDNKNNPSAFETSLKLFENLGMVLKQAETLLQKDPSSAAGRALLEDVKVEVQNVVEVMEAYQRKKRWKQIWKASIYRKRVEEAAAAISQMIAVVNTALQGQSLAEIRDLGDNMARLEGNVMQDLATRRKNRERELIQEEAIPENRIEIDYDFVIGSGGAGKVYMASYAGINAAAKVVKIGGEGRKAEQQRKLFLTEVRNMRRLNQSPRVVRVYGMVYGINTRPSEHVLVMEYMSGGDLFSFIKKHRDGELPDYSEELARNLINDVGHGLACLHEHDTWHGDLKSLNILLDADKRAKISDFGTSHWTAETASKRFMSQVPEEALFNQFSFHWAAPEVLEYGSQSFMSDVYSFGIVVWEILSREVPWGGLAGSEMARRVRFLGQRPEMPADAPRDLADLAQACWRQDPEDRLTCDEILAHLDGGFRAAS